MRSPRWGRQRDLRPRRRVRLGPRGPVRGAVRAQDRRVGDGRDRAGRLGAPGGRHRAPGRARPARAVVGCGLVDTELAPGRRRVLRALPCGPAPPHPGPPPRASPLAALGLAVLLGSIDLSGTLSYARGAEVGLISIVTAVSATYPIIPVFGGGLLFGERPAPNQYLGVAMVISGLIPLGAA